MKFLYFSLLVFFTLNSVTSEQCYWNKECKYKYFSSKTPYENVRGDLRDSILKLKGCEQISVWSLIRHGKRNPGGKFMQNIEDVLKFKEHIKWSYVNGKNTTLCAQDVQNIINWQVDKSFLTEPNKISAEGLQEMVDLANRMKETLPEIFNELSKGDFLLRPAIGDRSLVSAQFFLQGLKNKYLYLQPAINGISLEAPYAACGKFQDEVFRNPNIYQEVVEYQKSADYLNMKDRIERKLGLNFTLSHNNVIALYDLCRYSWNGIENVPCPWCAIFSDEDLEVLEYFNDLEQYYRNGYGTLQYSKIFGQITMSDLYKNFVEAKNGKGKKLVSYFSHASILDMVAVALNFHNDAHTLTGASRNMNRKWRTTFISPFASNLIAILHRCEKQSSNEFDYKVVFYWNERPVSEACDKGVCSWQEFENQFKPFLNATTDFCEFLYPLKD